MTGLGAPGRNWTLVLRRRPARMVAEGSGDDYGDGSIDAYELICCDCGDDPDVDYREVSPELRRIRGPYLIAAGVAAYSRHVALYQSQAGQAADASRV